MSKYKLTWKDLSWSDFKVYVFAPFKAFLPKNKIGNLDDLESFIQFIPQKTSCIVLF